MEMAAALCIQQSTDGGKDFSFAVNFFFSKDCTIII